jgi:hypothetical protein
MELLNGEPKDFNGVYWKADSMQCLIKLEWFLEWTAENGLGEAIAPSFIVISLYSSKDREQNYGYLCDDSWTTERGFHSAVCEEKFDAFSLCWLPVFSVQLSEL